MKPKLISYMLMKSLTFFSLGAGSRFTSLHRGWKQNILFLVFYIQTVNIQYSISKPQYLIFKPQYSIFRLQYLCYFHYLNNYDLHRYSLFFYKSHVRYCSPPRHNAFICNEYYLMAEVVQKISNYKQNMHAPS